MKRKMLIMFLLLGMFLFGCAKSQDDGGPYEQAEVTFSLKPGAYTETQLTLELYAPGNYTIRYTTDGSLPDWKSKKYTGSIQITGNGNNWLNKETVNKIAVKGTYPLNVTENIPDAWIIRAAAFAPDRTMGPVTIGTFFPGRSIKEDYYGTMVISLVCEPDDLFDYENGILVSGKTFDEWTRKTENRKLLEDANNWWQIKGNFSQKGKEWERPVSVEIFDGSDTLSIKQDAGLRIHGGASRVVPHRSFRINFSKQYGKKNLNYVLLPENKDPDGEAVSSYRSIVLRNGGNTANDLIFKDSWQQSLLKEEPFITQNCRPAVVYLNGEYWGVYCLNERYTEEYFAERLHIEDPIIIKEGKLEEGKEADLDLYDQLRSFEHQDLSEEEVWESFKQTVDVENMAAYFAAQIYMGNYDFGQDMNDELWRSRTCNTDVPYADGKWRFMMFDTEFSSGLYSDDRTSCQRNSVVDVIEKYPLFASAVHCPEFCRLFLDALKRIGSVDFASERVDTTLQDWSDLYLPLMDEQSMRFTDAISCWNHQVEIIKDYYSNRYENIIPLAEETLKKYTEIQ